MLGRQLAVLNVFHKVGQPSRGYFAVSVDSQGRVQSKCAARPRLKRSREGLAGLPPSAEDGRLLETCTWEMMRAERGTWDARVGLSELMRDSIFSASLLQASICKGKILSIENLRTLRRSSQANSRHMSQAEWPQRQLTSLCPSCVVRVTVTGLTTHTEEH